MRKSGWGEIEAGEGFFKARISTPQTDTRAFIGQTIFFDSSDLIAESTFTFANQVSIF